LNAGYDIWKEVILDPVLANESFVVDVDSKEGFAKKSPAHAKVLELMEVWAAVSANVYTCINPTNLSAVQLHYFVNKLPPKPIEPSLLRIPEQEGEERDEEGESSEEEHGPPILRNWSDEDVLMYAMSLPAEWRKGRPRIIYDSAEETGNEEGEEEEEEEEGNHAKGAAN
jgi:hypothetical protein